MNIGEDRTMFVFEPLDQEVAPVQAGVQPLAVEPEPEPASEEEAPALAR